MSTVDAPLDAGKTPADIAPSLVGGMFGPATPEPVKALAAASMAAIPASAYRAALECIVTFDRRANLDRIACPTLVLAAEDDTLSPPRTMEKMAGRIPGAVYRCLAGVGHLAHPLLDLLFAHQNTLKLMVQVFHTAS